MRLKQDFKFKIPRFSGISKYYAIILTVTDF